MKSDHTKTPLYDALTSYGFNSDTTPFDVPGHKMGKGIPKRFIDDVGEAIFKLDVNSMRALDSLSNPLGVIKDAEHLAADLFGADHAFFLVNGSTSGVQNMILSVCSDQDKIILPRNMHKSAYNAIILAGAYPVYIDPVIDEHSGISMGVRRQDVIDTIESHPDAKAILLLHPNYFGYTSDIKTIIEYAHRKKMAVLVDQSHGSHFSLHPAFPDSAVLHGADLVTISMHKTGGSLSQSSILLHNNGIIPFSRVRSTINLFQSSSASYLLLASLDIARQQLALEKDARFTKMISLANEAKQKINALPGLNVLSNDILDQDGLHAHDVTKLTVDVSAYGMSGFQVYDLFKTDDNIQLELGETHVVLAIISLGDDDASIDRLIKAFSAFTKKHPLKPKNGVKHVRLKTPKMIMTPRQAFFKQSTLMEITMCEGCIAADAIMVYPPGIPLVVPGELITQTIIDDYQYLNNENNILIGSYHKNDQIFIKVLIP